MNPWSNEICHFVVMMQNIPQRRYIRAVGNLTNFEISCTGKIYEFSPKASVKFSPLSKYFHTRSIYTLKLRTSMLSWLRTSAATEWLARYLFNTQSQLICIIVAQPHPEPACNDDTCQPHNTLDMLIKLVTNRSVGHRVASHVVMATSETVWCRRMWTKIGCWPATRLYCLEPSIVLDTIQQKY